MLFFLVLPTYFELSPLLFTERFAAIARLHVCSNTTKIMYNFNISS